MSRPIEFRGKSIESQSKGKWAIGPLFSDPRDGRRSIWSPKTNYWTRVDPATVGQFTGLKDKNGKKIWEGDVLEKVGEDGFGANEGYKSYNETPFGSRDVATMDRFSRFWLTNELFGYEGEELESPKEWIVIGNIHDNPELIKGKEQ